MPYSVGIVLLFSYTAAAMSLPPPPPPGEGEGAAAVAEAVAESPEEEARGWQFMSSWASSSVVACVGGALTTEQKSVSPRATPSV